MRVLSQDMALAYDLPFISEKFGRQVAQKKFAFSPNSSILPKTREIKDPFSMSITLYWFFLFFPFSCSTKINSVDLFWLHVEFPCVKHTSKNAVSSRDQKLPAFMSSLAPGRTCDGGSQVEYLIVDRQKVGFYRDLLADFAEQRCEKVLDAIMSLCNKTRLLTRQGVADYESFSTRAMARQVRYLQIVMQAQRGPKLLPIQCPALLFKGYGVEPRACTIVSGLHCSSQQVQLLQAVLLLTLRQRIAVRLQLSGLVHQDPLVLAERLRLAKKNWKENIIDRFLSSFHIVFKRVNCTH